MRIELLGGAIRDLRDGVRFYDDQAEGVGRYFFDSLSAVSIHCSCMRAFT